MYDYDAEYRRLKAAGFQGWAGNQHERNFARIAEALDRLEREGFVKPPARMLELGCGNGMSSSLLMARKGYEVNGIDISETAVAWARERFAESALYGSFRKGSVCEMPFLLEKSFDVVIDGSCLHCLIGNDRTRCLREVHRILRSEGVFVVSSMCGLPRSEEVKARFDPQTGHLLEDGQPFRTLKPLADIASELKDSGFEVQDTWLRTNPWWDHATMICRIINRQSSPG